MGVEIERKYLVNRGLWDKASKDNRHLVTQGYILNKPGKTIRVRLADNKGFITIKGISTGAARPEFEYEIPEEDSKELLENFCDSIVSKIRNNITYKDKLWEVDEFLDDNAGLIIAEIELSDEEELFDVPEWVEKEVTGEESTITQTYLCIRLKNGKMKCKSKYSNEKCLQLFLKTGNRW